LRADPGGAFPRGVAELTLADRAAQPEEGASQSTVLIMVNQDDGALCR